MYTNAFLAFYFYFKSTPINFSIFFSISSLHQWIVSIFFFNFQSVPMNFSIFFQCIFSNIFFIFAAYTKEFLAFLFSILSVQQWNFSMFFFFFFVVVVVLLLFFLSPAYTNEFKHASFYFQCITKDTVVSRMPMHRSSSVLQIQKTKCWCLLINKCQRICHLMLISEIFARKWFWRSYYFSLYMLQSAY